MYIYLYDCPAIHQLFCDLKSVHFTKSLEILDLRIASVVHPAGVTTNY